MQCCNEWKMLIGDRYEVNCPHSFFLKCSKAG